MEKETVSRDDIKEVLEQTKKEVDNFETYFNRPYKYSIWITNLCLGLLGFYIAILLQMRGKAPLEGKLNIILTFISLLIPIGYGVFFRFKYEVLMTYKAFKKFFNQINTFLKEVDNKFKEKGEIIISNENSEKEDFKISWNFIERWGKKPILYGLLFQFLFFLFALIKIIIFLVLYLFSK